MAGRKKAATATKSKRPKAAETKARPQRVLGRTELQKAGARVRRVVVPNIDDEYDGVALVGPVSAAMLIRVQDYASEIRALEQNGGEVPDDQKTNMAYAMFDLLVDALVDEDCNRLYKDREDLLSNPIDNLVAVAQAIVNDTSSVTSAGGQEGNA